MRCGGRGEKRKRKGACVAGGDAEWDGQLDNRTPNGMAGDDVGFLVVAADGGATSSRRILGVDKLKGNSGNGAKAHVFVRASNATIRVLSI